jgi:di/tripeptidase
MAHYTSSLAEALAPDLLSRLDRYVRIDTQARRDRTGCPSTPGQLELAAILATELSESGLRARASTRTDTSRRRCRRAPEGTPTP